MNAEKLKYQYTTLSFESGVMNIRQISDELRQHLVNYVTNAKTFIHELMMPANQHKNDFVASKSTLNILKTVNYMSIEQATVYVPSGMTVTMPEFLEALSACMHVTNLLVNECLKPALVYFSHLLSAPETLLSVTGPGARGQIVLHTKQIETAKALMSGCFSGDVADTHREFGKVYGRNKDYIESAELLQKLCEMQAKNAPGDVMHHLSDLTEVMDRLMLRMQEHPNEYKVNGITSQQIADTTDALAREVEFFAATAFHLQTVVVAMRDTDEKLKSFM